MALRSCRWHRNRTWVYGGNLTLARTIVWHWTARNRGSQQRCFTVDGDFCFSIHLKLETQSDSLAYWDTLRSDLVEISLGKNAGEPVKAAADLLEIAGSLPIGVCTLGKICLCKFALFIGRKPQIARNFAYLRKFTMLFVQILCKCLFCANFTQISVFVHFCTTANFCFA